MLFFSGVRTAEPLWALIDVYGLTRGVQLLGKMLNGARGARVSNQPSNGVKSPWDRSLPGPNFISRERQSGTDVGLVVYQSKGRLNRTVSLQTLVMFTRQIIKHFLLYVFTFLYV